MIGKGAQMNWWIRKLIQTVLFMLGRIEVLSKFSKIKKKITLYLQMLITVVWQFDKFLTT